MTRSNVKRFARARAAARCERGVTLIELLVAMLCAIFVFAGGVTFLVVTYSQQNRVESRNVSKNNAENGLNQLVLDLRIADTDPSISTSATTTTLSFDVPTPGSGSTSSELVTWTCTGSATAAGTCTRVLGSGATAESRVEVAGVESLSATPYSDADPPAQLSLPLTGSTIVAAVKLQLAVQDSSYGATSVPGTATTAIAGSGALTFDALADLRNAG